ncbi:hypothetical protein [Shinella zoogloeoides]|uniref:hypothetical protein n=1 Tax=Shinella zoogloeoides TaxID=352475 RepID=UPI00273FB441|nr:hypothetical protein [Shinella zoogloeoides]WLR94219.1 hypothetical protein Q9316_08640 [Shinella zoogloeoides]
MARPKKTEGELKDQRVPLVMSPSELQELDDWMHENRIRSRGEAIRRLCQMGMAFDRNYEQIDQALNEVGELIGKYLDIVHDEKATAEMLEEFVSGAIYPFYEAHRRFAAAAVPAELYKGGPNVSAAREKVLAWVEGSQRIHDDLLAKFEEIDAEADD